MGCLFAGAARRDAGGGGSAFVPLVYLTFDDGVDGAPADSDPSGFSDLLGTGTVTFSSERAYRGGQSARFFMDPDVPSDQGAKFVLPMEANDELWVRVRTFFPEGYEFVPNSEGQKYIRANTRDGSGTYTGAWDYYIAAGGIVIATGVARDGVQREFYREHCAWEPPGTYPCRNVGPDTPIGRWVTHEFYVKLSSTATGIIRGWVDGELVYELTNVRTRPSDDVAFFEVKLFSGPQPGRYSQEQVAFVDSVAATSSAAPPPHVDAAGNPMIGDWEAP